TATKAGGVSFYRMVIPLVVLSALAVPLNFAIQEAAAVSTAQQRILHREVESPNNQIRFDFAYESPNGWTWAVKELNRGRGHLRTVLIESPVDSAGLRWGASADSAKWNSQSGVWTLHRGASHLVGDSGIVASFTFGSVRMPALDEAPEGLIKTSLRAEAMRVGELAAHLERLERSGADAGMLAVDLPLRYAVPVACL